MKVLFRLFQLICIRHLPEVPIVKGVRPEHSTVIFDLNEGIKSARKFFNLGRGTTEHAVSIDTKITHSNQVLVCSKSS